MVSAFSAGNAGEFGLFMILVRSFYMYNDITLNYAFAMPGMGELVIIFLIVLVLFGAGKIPKIAKDIGSGIKEFKKSIKDEPEDKK